MSNYSIHKIKFNKKVAVNKIKKHCLKLLGKKSFTITSLVKSNDVVNLPAKYSIKKSYKKEIHADYVVYIGQLKPSHVKMHGAGLGDIFNKIKSTVSNIFSLRDGFNNKAQSMLTKYGDMQINDMSIFRAPVEGSSLLVKVINGLSSQNIPDEKLYHLGLVLSVGSTKIRIEKNEVIAIDDMFNLKPGTETIAVSLNKQLTLNDLLNNTVNKIGKEKMFMEQLFQNGKDHTKVL